jgi:outer membrane protein OmpA-like peptidoglycan-associated protein
MRQSVLISLLGVAALVSGCATKKYVRATEQPISDKVDVATSTNGKQDTEIAADEANIAKNAQAISATDERVAAADRRAGDAMTKANQVDQKTDKNAADIVALRGVVANIDDYKPVGDVTVLFPLNRATLSADDKAQLDMIASTTSNLKKFFVAVEGFTDKTGPADYNLQLSQRRADAVVVYLASQKSVPFYQIRTVGLGAEQPVDPGNNRAARAKNRRVEVKVFSADQASAQAR